MARYIIATWNDDHTKRYQRERACLAAAFWLFNWRVSEECLRAFGKLDTPAAQTLMARAEKLDGIMSVGECRALSINNTGLTVTLTREA